MRFFHSQATKTYLLRTFSFTNSFFSLLSIDIFLLGRQSSMMKSDKLYSMGTSFDERSDDESSYEFKVPVSRNNSSKNLAVESIPLVSK